MRPRLWGSLNNWRESAAFVITSANGYKLYENSHFDFKDLKFLIQ